jgi:hypothetical protein
MTPVTQILILLKIFFSPFFIVNILKATDKIGYFFDIYCNSMAKWLVGDP